MNVGVCLANMHECVMCVGWIILCVCIVCVCFVCVCLLFLNNMCTHYTCSMFVFIVCMRGNGVSTLRTLHMCTICVDTHTIA